MVLSVAFVIGCAMVLPLPTPAQTGKPDSKGSSTPPAKGDTPPAKPSEKDEAEKQGVVDTSKTEKAGLEERFVDERADALLDKDLKAFPQLSWRVAPTTPNDEKAVLQMAKGGQLDRPLIDRFVKTQLSQLTNHANVLAMLDDEADSQLVKKFDDAARKLVQMIDTANDNNAVAFRKEYTKDLVANDVGPKVMTNNLYARNEFMVALSRTRDDQAIPMYIKQLDDRDQVVMAKHLAAVGLINLTQGGQRLDVDGSDAIRAAKALCEFLENERDSFWPVHARALQALGSLRQSTEDPAAGKQAEFAETALSYLADPKVNPSARAWAAWALGMMPPVAAKYNFALIASHAGLAAADIAGRIVDDQSKNQDLAKRYTDLLLQIYQAFRVDPGQNIRKGGLMAMNLDAAQQSAVSEVEKRVRGLAKAALDLINAGTRQQPAARDQLASLAKELRGYIGQHLPRELTLVPDGKKVFAFDNGEVGAALAADHKAAADAKPADGAPRPRTGGSR
jgi:hypothetical protein